jgi:hypothetical protein
VNLAIGVIPSRILRVLLAAIALKLDGLYYRFAPTTSTPRTAPLGLLRDCEALTTAAPGCAAPTKETYVGGREVFSRHLDWLRVNLRRLSQLAARIRSRT